MSFDDRFELGELLRDDGIRTFSARDKTGGQDLLAHFFSNAAETPKLLASLERLPERERQRIVDRGERDGAPYVVTGTLAGHPGFREWLTANARDAKPLGAAGAWKVIPAQPSVDEQFLSLFPTSESPQLQPEAAPAPPPPSAPEAGAFTRMFQAPANLFPPQPPLPLPPQPPPQPAPARSDLVNREPAKSGPAPNNEPARNNEPAKNNEPGEFTRMFQALPPHTQPGQTSLPTAPPPASPKTEAAGEFTRFFEAQVHESHVRQADLPPVQAMPAASRQGEFTRVFGPGQTLGRSSDKPGAAPPAPVPLRAPEAPRVPGPAPQATRVFAPSPFAAPASSSASPSAPPSGTTPFPEEQGDGEFTRRFSVAPALSLGQPSETPAPSAPSTGNASPSGPAAASRWPLYLGIAAIAVLLVAVLLFVLSRAK